MNIGKIAETQLAAWCAQAGITATRPDEDRAGWDYHLEIPTATQDNLEGSPTRVSCQVQIKATRTQARESIKLSNWHSHVHSPLPFFFIILLFGGANQITQVSVVHVDKSWTEKVLKRIRRAETKASTKRPLNLHKKTLDLTWSSEHALSPPDGSALRQRLLSDIGAPFEYAKKKAAWLTETGYEPRPCTTQFSTGPDISYSDFADLGIGLVESLRFKKVTISSTRFGINKTDAQEEGGSFRFDHLPTLGAANVLVRNPKSGEEATFPTNGYASSLVFPWLPKEFHKMRFANDFISLMIDPQRKAFETTHSFADVTDSVLLETAEKVAKAARLLASSPEPLELAITSATHKHYTFATGTISQAESQGDIEEATELAWRISKHFDIDPNTRIELSPLLASLDPLRVLDAAFQAESITASFTPDQCSTKAGERAAAIIPASAKVGSQYLVALVVVEGPSSTPAGVPSTIEVTGFARVKRTWTVSEESWDDWRHDDLVRFTDYLAEELEHRFDMVCVDRSHQLRDAPPE